MRSVCYNQVMSDEVRQTCAFGCAEVRFFAAHTTAYAVQVAHVFENEIIAKFSRVQDDSMYAGAVENDTNTHKHTQCTKYAQR